MKTSLLALLVFVVISARLVAADVTGMWTLVINPDFGGTESVVDCAFKQNGEQRTARCGEEGLGDRDTTMIGTWQLADNHGKREGTFNGKKHQPFSIPNS